MVHGSFSTEVFLALLNSVDGVLSDNSVSAIERFISLMYDKITYISNVNDCQRMLLTKESKTIDNIPPTRNALIQHVKSAVYQAWQDGYQYALIHCVLYD